MGHKNVITAPFFEIGPKSYLYGDAILSLAKAAEKAAKEYDVDVLFTAPFTELYRVSEITDRVVVLAPHMDSIRPGRGVASILPEAVKAAGAKGVMLNHCEKPLCYSSLRETIIRAKEIELLTVVCAGSIEEAEAVAYLEPDIIIAEPPELVGTGKSISADVIEKIVKAIRSINDKILVLTAAGISNGDDVYRSIISGADAVGASSGIACAENPEKMVDEMIKAVRIAYDKRESKEFNCGGAPKKSFGIA